MSDDARTDEPWLPATWHEQTLDEAFELETIPPPSTEPT